MNSIRTTVCGIVTILAAILNALQALLDTDPATNPQWSVVAAAIAVGVGLILARDNNKTSEQAGAGPTDSAEPYKPETPDAPNAPVWALIAILPVLWLTGCATSEQAQPSKLDQPQKQTQASKQADEQAANVAIVQTVNVLPAGTEMKAPAGVNTDANGWYVPAEAKFKVTLPDGRQVETSSSVATISTQTITVTTHGQSSKEGSATAGQTGGAQSAQSTATATPENKPDTSVSLPVQVNAGGGAGTQGNTAASTGTTGTTTTP